MYAPTTLIAAAEKAILKCRTDPKDPVKGGGEVAEVARVVLNGPRNLVNEWAPHLGAGTLSVVGVFTHQTPKAIWVDPRDGKTQRPELGDLLVVVDRDDGVVRTQRALLIQAKVADTKQTGGRFSLGKDGPAIQRYMYAHWPAFELTGFDKHAGPFDIKPAIDGQCAGSRYATVNIETPSPASGWWVESAQPSIPAKPCFGPPRTPGTTLPSVPADQRDPLAMVGYDGSFDATVPFGQALRDMLVGTLGAILEASPEWGDVVEHLKSVALERDSASRKMSGVKAVRSTAELKNIKSESRVMKFAPVYYYPGGQVSPEPFAARSINLKGMPPLGMRWLAPFASPPSGFGILYIRLDNVEWREEAGPVSNE
jgi:hypothetical protein